VEAFAAWITFLGCLSIATIVGVHSMVIRHSAALLSSQVGAGALSRWRTESTSVTRKINPAECEAENHTRAWDNYRQHSDVASANRDDR